MQTLKKIISRYMRSVTFFLVIVLLALILYIQIIHEQKQALETATETFSRIGQLLEKTRKSWTKQKKHTGRPVCTTRKRSPI